MVRYFSVALLVFKWAAKIFIVYLGQIYSNQWTNYCYTDIFFEGLGVYCLMRHFYIRIPIFFWNTVGVENIFHPAVCRKEYVFHYCSLKMPQGTNECLRFYCHSVLKEYYSYVEYSGQNIVSGKRSMIFVVLNWKIQLHWKYHITQCVLPSFQRRELLLF